jgi:hypothetical protein
MTSAATASILRTSSTNRYAQDKSRRFQERFLDVTAKGAINMSSTIRRLWLRLLLSSGLVTAAVAATSWHTDPILAGLPMNHCEPMVRDQ